MCLLATPLPIIYLIYVPCVPLICVLIENGNMGGTILKNAKVVGSTWSLCQELMSVNRGKNDCIQRHTLTHMGKSRENEGKILWERDIF